MYGDIVSVGGVMTLCVVTVVTLCVCRGSHDTVCVVTLCL